MVLLEATGTILIDSIPSMFSFEDEDDDTLDDWEAMMEAQKTCMCLYKLQDIKFARIRARCQHIILLYLIKDFEQHIRKYH